MEVEKKRDGAEQTPDRLGGKNDVVKDNVYKPSPGNAAPALNPNEYSYGGGPVSPGDSGTD